MDGISHHIPETIITSYVSGSLPRPFASVVAAHVSICDDCRASVAAGEAVGGAILQDTPAADVPEALRDAVFAHLDDVVVPEPVRHGQGPYPAPIWDALGHKEPKWRTLGPGAKQCILQDDEQGSLRLFQIAPGFEVPDHGHNGLEMTLVLKGAFRDEAGRFARGDVEVADGDVEHTPHAEEGEVCICLAATDAPLRFNSLMPRLLQPIFRI